MPQAAVLGFRPHTYWTAVVALAGPASAPRVLAREKIVFATGAERLIYHQAAEAAAERAAPMIEANRVVTEANTARALRGILDRLKGAGTEARLAVVPKGTAKLPDDLADILSVHTRMHAAEGVFYRDVVAAACATLGLEVERAVERELPALVGDVLGVDETTVQSRLKLMGAELGAPWSVDQRLATLAAWLHLEEA